MNQLPSDNTESGKLSAGKNIPCWFEPEIHTNLFPELNCDLETDVVIVGGGLAGLTTAYCLIQTGKKIILIEDGFIGSGETGRTTAQIVTALDDRYFNMEKIFGKENTALIAESHKTAIEFIEKTVQKEKIDCDFKRINGYLFLHDSDEEESLKKELNALHRSGLEAHLLDDTPGMLVKEKCILYPNQAQFQPMKYLMGLCRAIEKKGGKIFTNTHATEIDTHGIKSGKGFTIKADHVVVATNAPVNDKYAMILKQWAYRSYVIGALIKKNSLPQALWWDTGDHEKTGSAPYHYVRLHSYNDDYDLLISGGEDHLAGQALEISEEERYAILEKWTRERFPIQEVVSKWSGEVLVPMDSIAFIGRNRFDKDNVYIITGDSGIGMTYCTIGGILITDLINDLKNKWEDIYKPSRFTLPASMPFFRMLKEDIIAVLKKWFYTDSVELSTIRENEASIVNLDGKKCGAYRDSRGQLFLVSAECTHLKCMVTWNNDEKSWDCPCHGSRFTFSGKVINGPANEDLPSFTSAETNQFPD
jgi:glycine/D-amino acid oxidase-like deaminating enzyme/nitrite reductase/ring-hydroxylating ferredoxin subunit